MPRFSRIRRVLLAIACVLVSASVFLVDHGRASKPRGRYDAIVVAGCRVRPNGEPSAALDRRVRHAVALLRDGIAPSLVVTGGLEPNGFVEADVAARLAIALGVAPRTIVREGASRSTEENARFSARLLGPERRVLVVTDEYHVFRARRVFARYFAAADATGARAPVRAQGAGLVRELGAVTIYAAIGRL